jgi:hypothetical protein
LAIWLPLLESVAANHEHFPTVLTSHIITRLLAEVDPTTRRDPGDDATMTTTTTTTGAATAVKKASHDVCLAAWGAWLVEWRRAHESEADVSTRRQAVFFQLVQALAAHSQRREASSPSHSQTGYVLPTTPTQVMHPLCPSPPPSLPLSLSYTHTMAKKIITKNPLSFGV